jgi:CBS domain containing-hemolysin-like protein
MLALGIAIALTLGLSAVCSLMEAFILSTTVSEVESLKKRHQRAGGMLERFKTGIDETSSAILTLNTIANTLGASIVGVLAGSQFSGHPSEKMLLGIVTGGMVC